MLVILPQYICKMDIVLNFNLSIILLIALRLSWVFLCLNEWMFQMRFLLLWKILSSLSWLLSKNGTSFYLAFFYPFKLILNFSVNLLKMPNIWGKKKNTKK